MKIYTRTGDQGKTSLVGGQRVSKTCTRLESYGTIDELCSHIGLLVTYCTDTHDCEFLMAIQGKLFVVGGYLATDTSQRDVHPGNIVKEEMVASWRMPSCRFVPRMPHHMSACRTPHSCLS